MSEDDENELSQEELDEVYKNEAVQYRDSLLSYAKKICNSKADAEDLVQDTMLRAYKFIDKYEPGTNCQAWLYTIMKNLYNNRYKRYKKSPDNIHYDEPEKIFDQTTDSSITDDPEDLVLRNLLSGEVLKAIRQLSVEFRITLILVDVHDFSYENVGKMLDCPIGTVMSRLHRARNILQDNLESHAREKGVVKDEKDEQISYN